jgi:hypothetical protein
VRLALRPMLVGLLLIAVACRSIPSPPTSALIPRYIVTTAPIDVGVAPGMAPRLPDLRGLCVAVNPTDPQGVWWWEPGQSGCSSRSTGPDVFRADEATVVARTESAEIEVRFRLQLHGRPGSTMPSFVDVRLTIRDGNMLAAATGARVTTERRNDLKVLVEP